MQQQQRERVTWFGRLLGYKTEQEIQAQHQALLEAAAHEDFSDLDGMGFLQVAGRDHRDRPIVVVSARLYHAGMIRKERALQYLAHKLQLVCQEPYTVVWLHTKARYWTNCPSTWWMWKTYESLPCWYRENLSVVHIVHCDLSLWGGTLVALPWWSDAVWQKVNWVARVEFLWDHMDKRVMLPLIPEYVIEHDQDLEDQPLVDYGIVASKDMATAIPGGPPPPM